MELKKFILDSKSHGKQTPFATEFNFLSYVYDKEETRAAITPQWKTRGRFTIFLTLQCLLSSAACVPKLVSDTSLLVIELHFVSTIPLRLDMSVLFQQICSFFSLVPSHSYFSFQSYSPIYCPPVPAIQSLPLFRLQITLDHIH